MTADERAARALPCTIWQYRGTGVAHPPDCAAHHRPAVAREISEAVEEERARVLRLVDAWLDDQPTPWTVFDLRERIATGAAELE